MGVFKVINPTECGKEALSHISVLVDAEVEIQTKEVIHRLRMTSSK